MDAIREFIIRFHECPGKMDLFRCGCLVHGLREIDVIGVVIYSICKQRGVNLTVIDQKSMFLRCLTGLIAMILYFSALGLIPIGQAVTLQYTNPLFVALLSVRFYPKKCNR